MQTPTLSFGKPAINGDLPNALLIVIEEGKERHHHLPVRPKLITRNKSIINPETLLNLLELIKIRLSYIVTCGYN